MTREPHPLQYNPHPLTSIKREKTTRGRDGAKKLMSDITTGAGWCLHTTTKLYKNNLWWMNSRGLNGRVKFIKQFMLLYN